MSARVVEYDATGIPVMSRSGLEASQCGHRYKGVYVDGLADESEYSRRGTAIHLCRRKYVEKLAAEKVGMDADLAEAAFLEGVTEANTPPALVPEVREVYERHVALFELNLDAFIAAEHRRVRKDVAVPYQFEPDLEYAHYHDNTLEIQDIKTYFRGFTESQAKGLLQTRFYLWCAMQEFPNFGIYRFTYDFIRLNQRVSVEMTADDFDTLDREIRALDGSRRARHANQDWEASPGEACAFCNLACPVLDDVQRAYVRVNSAESFAAVAGARIVMEKTLKLMDKAIKNYAKIEGPQNVQGEEFAFRPSVSAAYPAAVVVDTVRAQGQAPTFTVSASSLKPLFKVLPHLREDLDPVKTEKTSMRFGHKSLKQRESVESDESDDDATTD